MEAICFSEKSADFTGLHGVNSEDITLHNYRFENLELINEVLLQNLLEQTEEIYETFQSK
jgi:hypothetical protein